MRKLFGGIALSSVAALVLASGAFAASPADGDYCFAQSGGCNATWTADTAGHYGGVTSGTWDIQVQVACPTGVTGPCWSDIASGGPGPLAASGGPGPFSGSLAANHTYKATITGSGGLAIGNASGSDPATP